MQPRAAPPHSRRGSQGISPCFRDSYQQSLPVDWLLADVANAQKMLVSGRSFEPADHSLALRVVPEQIALVIG